MEWGSIFMKFDHIVFPIDFSERSRALNAQVEWLAGQFGSRVTLLHVFEIPAAWYGACEASFTSLECLDTVRDAAARRLAEYTIHVPENRLERVFLQGNAAAEILNWQRERDADLLVMGTHGYGALKGLILGSVSAKLLHSANCAVWIDSVLHSPPASDIRKILCAVELTEEGVPLLRFAKELGAEIDAAVRLIHSVPEMQARPDKYFDLDLHRYLTESARVEICKMQREAGTDFPLTISGRGIASALTEGADEFRANLVLIGRGRSQNIFGRLQTHAYEIIQCAPCPVLSYSPRQPDRISSSCSAERLVRSAEGALLPTGFRTL